MTNIVKNSDKSKYVYSRYEIAFDGAGLWSFGNNFSRNIVIFPVDSFDDHVSVHHLMQIVVRIIF